MNDNRISTCPKCGSHEVVKIIYGLPGPELVEKSERGEVLLGGCIVKEDNPDRACKSCRHRWREREEVKEIDHEN